MGSIRQLISCLYCFNTVLLFIQLSYSLLSNLHQPSQCALIFLQVFSSGRKETLILSFTSFQAAPIFIHSVLPPSSLHAQTQRGALLFFLSLCNLHSIALTVFFFVFFCQPVIAWIQRSVLFKTTMGKNSCFENSIPKMYLKLLNNTNSKKLNSHNLKCVYTQSYIFVSVGG